ncbi:hypothetical protein KAZ82_00715 [Candidatus Babeliales bacterium]|nr:hypothetical protein [Candidatus Babeliales bacterium]
MAIIKKLLLISVLGLGASMKVSAEAVCLPVGMTVQLTDEHISDLVAAVLVKYATISTGNVAQVLKELRNAILESIAKAPNKAQYVKLSQALHGLNINHIADLMIQLVKIKEVGNHLPKQAKSHINQALKKAGLAFQL